MFDGNSDYVVEDYIKPNKIRVPLVNDESADLLGNFDDAKRKEIEKRNFVPETEDNPFVDDDDDENDNEDEENENGDDDILEQNSEESSADLPNEITDDEMNEKSVEIDTDELIKPTKKTPTTDKNLDEQKKKKNQNKKNAKSDDSKIDNSTAATTGHLSSEQMTALMKGSSKQNRFVLYVTNLNYESSKERLMDFFGTAGDVKSVRIPKNRKTAFAFVEMDDIISFKNALALHNNTLDNYKVKIQVSEGGKKKSANKKNIIKQKNRKLAEMRNESKQFNRSGKGYDKTIKKEIRQNQMQQQRRMAKKQLKKVKKA